MHDHDQEQSGIRRGRRFARPRLSAEERRALSAPFLSVLWPGLGQLQLGRWRWALLHALPPLALMLLLAVELLFSAEGFALRLRPSFALGVIGLIAAHALWRALSIFDAWWAIRSAPLRRDRALPLVLLLSLAAHTAF